MRLQPLLIGLVVVAVIAAVAYIGLFLRVPVERPLAYWPVDDRTLEVVFLDAPELDCRIAQVDESNEAVRVHARCLERVIPMPQTGAAEKHVFRVTLQGALGGRVVFDGNGDRATECQLPGLDCIAPE